MSAKPTKLHNAPLQSTPFIGRELEIANITNILRDDHSRLLTLVGSGGIGKTRLAIESAQCLTFDDFEHGVFYVPLAPLTSAENIVNTIISVLGIMISDDQASQQKLVKFLSQRNLLLVLDNFEHLLAGVELVADILNHAPNIKILATSREVLNLRMERLWHVNGMPFPESDDIDDIEDYDALKLFIDRATWVRHDFLIETQLECVIRICQFVGGMPLGIELAATWLKTLSCQDIMKQIEHDIDILATRASDIPERHRSIHAVFDHSWQLLSADEQAVFSRLSVFRGGFILEAAEKVAGADLMTLSGLVEKSMVRRDATGRYDLHELLRQYAHTKVEMVNELDDTLSAHTNYYARFMAERISDLKGGRQIDALNEICVDIDNIREAWQDICRHSQYELLDGMLECFIVYFDLLRFPPIAQPIYQYAIDHLDDSKIHHHQLLRNRVHVFLLYSKMRLNTTASTSRVFLEDFPKCHRLAETFNDRLSLIFCQIIANDYRSRQELLLGLQHARAISEELGDSYYIGSVLDLIAFYYTGVKIDKSDVGLEHIHRYREISQLLSNEDGIANSYIHLARYEEHHGNIRDAVQSMRQAELYYKKIQHIHGIALACGNLTWYSFQLGNFDDVHPNMQLCMEQLESVGFLNAHPFGYALRAKVNAMLGEYESGKYLLAQTLPYQPVEQDMFHIYSVSMMCAVGLGDYATVYPEAIKALDIDYTFIGDRLMVDFLPLMAFLYHHHGKFRHAVKILGLTFEHPMGVTDWMTKWSLLTELFNSLKYELGEEAFLEAWASGAQIDLQRAVASIRKYLQQSIGSNRILPNSGLVERLTPKQLDILCAMVSGKTTDRELADEFVITKGTVRSHVHAITQKLSAQNRTEAVLRALELGLCYES